jgi:hypothetical protein
MATFTANVQGQYVIPISLSANLTDITLSGAEDAQQILVEFQQDGTGGWMVASSSIPSLQQPSSVANTNSFQSFVWNSVAGQWQSLVTSAPGGVTSLNSLTGALNVIAGVGMAVAVSGSDVVVTNTGALTSVTPWLDVQDYGGVPKPTSFASESTSCTTNGTTAVTLGTAKNFVNNEGVVIWAGGPPCSVSSTPSAPTMTCPSVAGSGPSGTQQTITYQLAAFDMYGGISAASSSGTITTAPAIFGAPYVTVSSISQSSGTVTVNFSSPISPNVAAGMTLHLKGFTSSSAIFNGVWTIASAPSTSQVTFALSGSLGSGTASASTKGRVSNVALISAISRNSAGLITITTAEPHNFTTQSGNNPTVINIENTQSSSGYAEDLNGQFLITSASSSTITIQTGNLTPSTGTVLQNGASRGASTATVWEFITVACPAISTNAGKAVASISQSGGVVTVNFSSPLSSSVSAGQTLTLAGFVGTSAIFNGIWELASAPTTSQVTFALAGSFGAGSVGGATGILADTIGYYVYSDSPNPGGSLSLIGKTLAGESHFTDWGPFYGGGYVAPGYVPTTPPGSAQAQLFRSSVVSGAGSTSLVLATAPNISFSALSGTIVHDDSASLNNAAQAGVAAGSTASVNFSPPGNIISLNSPSYVINYPVAVPNGFNILVGCGLIINETIVYAGTNSIYSPFGSTTQNSPQFAASAKPTIAGLGNPMFLLANSCSLFNLGFDASIGNGLNQVMFGTGEGASYVSVRQCSFTVNNNGTSVPLIYNGQVSGNSIEDLTCLGVSVLGDVDQVGQSSQGPPVPLVWLRASDNPLQGGIGPAGVTMSGGYNAFCSRGILVDQKYRTTGSTTTYQFLGYGFMWNQAMTQPAVMFWGQGASEIVIGPILNDSSFLPVLANWCFQGLSDVSLVGSSHAGSAPLICGSLIPNLAVSDCSLNPIGQTTSLTNRQTATVNPGNGPSIHPTTSGLSIQAQPFKLSNSGVVFGAVPRLTGVTAADAGAGSLSAGTYTVEVTQAGWDGGETGTSNVVSVTIAANHAIAVTWPSIGGFQGVNVYFDGFKQNASPLTGTSTTISSFGNQGIAPTDDATGLPSILNNANSGGLAVIQELILPSGTNKISATAPTLTGNRTLTLADGAQSTVLATSLTTTLNGSPYTISLAGLTSSSHVSITPTNSVAAADNATGSVYVGTKGAGTVVINTGATAGETFDIVATPN